MVVAAQTRLIYALLFCGQPILFHSNLCSKGLYTCLVYEAWLTNTRVAANDELEEFSLRITVDQLCPLINYVTFAADSNFLSNQATLLEVPQPEREQKERVLSTASHVKHT